MVMSTIISCVAAGAAMTLIMAMSLHSYRVVGYSQVLLSEWTEWDTGEQGRVPREIIYQCKVHTRLIYLESIGGRRKVIPEVVWSDNPPPSARRLLKRHIDDPLHRDFKAGVSTRKLNATHGCNLLPVGDAVWTAADFFNDFIIGMDDLRWKY